MTRRECLTSSAGTSALALAQASAPTASAATSPLKIAAFEFVRLEGHQDAPSGVDHQYQVQPLHIYDEHRPPEYHDRPGPVTSQRLSAIYLRIRTDQGLDGWYGPVDREAAVVADSQLGPFLKGKDPLAGEKLWDQMFRSNRHSRSGHFLMGISMVDNALWDLRGRYFQAPVYRLLGGPTRTSVEVYGSCLGFSIEPDKAAAKAVELKGQGFRNQKWFLAYGPGDGTSGLAKNVKVVAALREAVGDEVELMFDVYQGWTYDYALAWAKQVERYHPRWIEEIVSADKLEMFAQLRRQTSIPVASGEHIYGRNEAHRYLNAGALNVLQADPEWCGGVSELVKICTVASLYDVPVMPHGHGLHAAMHVIAAQSPAVCPLGEYLIPKMRSHYWFEKYAPALERAHWKLSERPGFGIEIDPAKVEKQSLVTTW